MLQRKEVLESYSTDSQIEAKPQRSDISLSKIKEILTLCHIETDKKLEELANKCVKKNEQQKA